MENGNSEVFLFFSLLLSSGLCVCVSTSMWGKEALICQVTVSVSNKQCCNLPRSYYSVSAITDVKPSLFNEQSSCQFELGASA